MQNIAAKLLDEYVLRHEDAAFRKAEATYFGQNIAAKLLDEYVLRHEDAAFRKAEATYFGQNGKPSPTGEGKQTSRKET